MGTDTEFTKEAMIAGRALSVLRMMGREGRAECYQSCTYTIDAIAYRAGEHHFLISLSEVDGSPLIFREELAPTIEKALHKMGFNVGGFPHNPTVKITHKEYMSMLDA